MTSHTRNSGPNVRQQRKKTPGDTDTRDTSISPKLKRTKTKSQARTINPGEDGSLAECRYFKLSPTPPGSINVHPIEQLPRISRTSICREINEPTLIPTSFFSVNHEQHLPSLCTQTTSAPENPKHKYTPTHSASVYTSQCSTPILRTAFPSQPTPTPKPLHQCKLSKKINSRRIAQRRAKRSRRQTETQNKKLQEQYEYYLNKHCTRQFGFCANPSKTKQNNFNYELKTQCIPIPSGQSTNLTYHNLCPNY
jgi:hypothetical protein